MKFLSICILANLEFAKAEIVALQQRVDSTVYKCELWMHKARDKVFVSPEVHVWSPNCARHCALFSLFLNKALTCTPPKDKIFKFKWRIQKALNDGIWHLNGRDRCEIDETVWYLKIFKLIKTDL